jgi:hypothetical protein
MQQNAVFFSSVLQLYRPSSSPRQDRFWDRQNLLAQGHRQMFPMRKSSDTRLPTLLHLVQSARMCCSAPLRSTPLCRRA